MEKYQDPIKGRGSQINPPNKFHKLSIDNNEVDGLDIPLEPSSKTEIFEEHPKKIINKVPSPDIPMAYSLNPYQGCEHGCIYCYARNTHQYWGFSAGLDFEQKIIVKRNAPSLLRKELNHKKWEGSPIMFSGNTDCYQPLEKKFQLTRQCLEICVEANQAVGIISKNSLILRDLDLLISLARKNLVHVYISITTIDEKLRSIMEPRTVTARKRFGILKTLSDNGIPCGVMIGPVIPGLNNHEIPAILENGAKAGALSSGYSLVRLNGPIGVIFENWINLHFPDRAEKVLNQIKACHAGELSDTEFGRRMRGNGEIADSINQLYKLAKQKYFADKQMPPYNTSIFRHPDDRQLNLF